MGAEEPDSKPILLIGAEIKTPPLSSAARVEAGFLLRLVQDGESLGMPRSRPMPSIGPRCHELRINDETQSWRIVYRMDPDAILVVEVFKKTTQATPKRIIELCQNRLRAYDQQ